MAGEARGAVAAYTQVKMTEAPRWLRLSEAECPEMWIRIPSRQRRDSWDKNDDPVVPLERLFCGHPLAGLLRERKFEEVRFVNGRDKVPTRDCLYEPKKLGVPSICSRGR